MILKRGSSPGVPRKVVGSIGVQLEHGYFVSYAGLSSGFHRSCLQPYGILSVMSLALTMQAIKQIVVHHQIRDLYTGFCLHCMRNTVGPGILVMLKTMRLPKVTQ